MIQISGMPFQQNNVFPTGSIESVIIQQMQANPAVYFFDSLGELLFELKLRTNIIMSAKLMNQGQARFTTFAKSRCNPQYWFLTNAGGFQLKNGVNPSDAIQDIYKNSSLYAFECATSIIIIYYHAVLNSIGEALFNQLFQNLYLYSWHFDSDLGIQTIRTRDIIPGDVIYFNNPDFNPKTSWWRGENAVVLENGTYFGHGIGIKTAAQMIQALNKRRRPGSQQSAYLTNIVTRPAFKYLAKLSIPSRGYIAYKAQHIVIHHNESSISYSRYLVYLNKLYNQIYY